MGLKVWYCAETHPKVLRKEVEKFFSICCNLETEPPQEKTQQVGVLFQKRVGFDSQRNKTITTKQVGYGNSVALEQVSDDDGTSKIL